MKDSLFLDPGQRKASFEFDESVTAVFDDMIKRSVPFYFEIQNMIGDLVESYYQESTAIYDLGCSTGTTIALLSKRLSKDISRYIGIDNSGPMLSRAEETLRQLNLKKYELKNIDLNNICEIKDASIVISNLVLQFLQPDNRHQLVKNIYEGLLPKGCFILVEKINMPDEAMNNDFISFHQNFKKRNLYSAIEIARKREALENILQPFTIEENRRLLQENGFKVVEMFFQWFNFCGLVAIKD